MYTDILKINCAVFYITSVKFIIRNVCTEHIYCLQDVLKKVCRVYCLQGVFKKRLQGVVKKIVCRVQKKSWAAGCRSAGCHVRLTVQTKRSSAGCILGLVMRKEQAHAALSFKFSDMIMATNLTPHTHEIPPTTPLLVHCDLHGVRN